MNPSVDDKRAAWETICELFTRVILAAIRWVELPDSKIIVCEGKEDINRYVIDDTGAFLEPKYEQVKAPMVGDRSMRPNSGDFGRAVITVSGVPNG